MEKQFDSNAVTKDSSSTTPVTTELLPDTAHKSNTAATRKRHMRVFGTSSYFGIIYMKTKKIIKMVFGILSACFKRTSRRFISSDNHVVVKDPFKTFVRQTVAIACSLFVVTSLPPTHILETGFTADYFSDTDFINADVEAELDLPSFIINEEGFVLKTAPITEDVSHIGYNDVLKHTVASGDTLTGIARLYGLSLKTILWENNLNQNSTLKIGQVLTIPPVDGVTHSVAEKGDTLESIAKKYGVDIALVKEHNNIEGDTIVANQRLFIPGGKLQQDEASPVIVRTGIRSNTGVAARPSTSSGGRTIAHVETYKGGTETSAACGKFLFPTIGKVTQGFQRGHYALDIGNVSKPDVWAACGGTVTKVVTGCPLREVRVDRSCGGGYGNYVVVDHGGKTQTLYAHLETIYVKVGESLRAGQALGKMGNSGRTYGATGRHLHVELYMSSQKKNLSNFM